MSDEPHVPDWQTALAEAESAARCGAKSRRSGSPCEQPAMPNGRCRLHGGKSTGPRTPEGLMRSRRARWKHGYYSAEAKAERADARATMRQLRELDALLQVISNSRPPRQPS
jgi:hypothetical protein